MEVRARGNFRREQCFYPPLRIKIKKKDAHGTVFEGNKSLKLVLPCQTNKTGNGLIIKEYLCYKIYENVTPYTFSTRLVNVNLTDNSGKQAKKYDVSGFLIEDDDLVAKRFNGRVMDSLQLHPIHLQDTSSTIHDFFEYMIANADWSSTAQHNIKVIQLESKRFIPLAYDFDMSGVVNAPYAVVNDILETSSVRERVYRGFCRPESLFEFVRSEYIALEPQILFDIKEHEKYFDPKEFNDVNKFINQFFDILKSDKHFRQNILLSCRTK